MRETEGLNVAVIYVCLKPVGFAFSSSRVRSVRFVIRIVDVVFGIEVISWKIGGLTVGFAYSTSVDMKKVEFKYAKFSIRAASGSEGAVWAKLMRARMREVEVLGVRGKLRKPPHMGPWGKGSREKAVTMPKLLPPPRRAKNRDGWLVGVMVVMEALGRTSWGCMRLEGVNLVGWDGDSKG